MPVVHSLSKVNRTLNKSKGAIHIKGRKFKQLNRATLREKKLGDRKLKHLIQKEKEMGIIYFFQKLINDDDDFKTQETFTFEEMKGFTEIFLTRYNEELEELDANRRPGRPLTNRHQLLQEKVKHENHLYLTGIKIPNLADKSTVQFLKLWNGTAGATTVMKFIQISKDMTELPVEEVEMS